MVFRIYLPSIKAEASVVASDGNGTRAEVRVKDSVTFFSVVIKEPLIELDGFLGGVEFSRLRLAVLL
jgi:hypothetical protein